MTILFLLPMFLYGQEAKDNLLSSKIEHLKINPVVAFQFWNTYTIDASIYDLLEEEYVAVDDRFNTQLRRSRLGIKGAIDEKIKFNLTAALDLVGRDILSGTEGGGNNGASPQFRAWNAFLQWKISPNTDLLHFTTGYFTPQIGRESITPAMRVTSMEKSWSQNYLRRHLVGTGPGRAVGINIGGRVRSNQNKIEFQYDFGSFTPQFQAYNGNSQGKKAAPLFVGRCSIDFGQPESKSYSTSHKINYFGKRNGLSIAIAAATQGQTDLFKNNKAIGGDFLFNWKNFNLDGEWTKLWRTAYSNDQVQASTGYLRASYNIKLKNNYWIEPNVLWMKFDGTIDDEQLKTAAEVKSLAGKDTNFNIGTNFYFNPDLKLSLSYTIRQASAGSDENGSIINNYYFQSGVGAVKRGDWFGLGLTFIL